MSAVFLSVFVFAIASSSVSAGCSSEDETLWLGQDGGVSFSESLEGFGLQCAFVPDMSSCIADKVREARGLSEECSECFGQSAQCTKNNCIFKGCMGGRCNSMCLQCVEENCQAALENCAGPGLTYPDAGC